MKPIAAESSFFSSPAPDRIFCYTPYLATGFHDRILASFDLGGPGVKELDGPVSDHGDFGLGNQARILVSDDGGHSFRETARLPMLHSRIFRAGRRLYFIGHSGRLLISTSDDNGDSWSTPSTLDNAGSYHQSGCSIDHRNGKVYLTMERQLPGRSWPGVEIILMSAPEEADLTRSENWQRTAPFNPEDYPLSTNLIGSPFYPAGHTCPDHPTAKRFCGEPGFLESNVLRIYDSSHQFFDPDDRSMLILMRAHTGLSNFGGILRGRELPDGSLQLELLPSPAGAPLLYLPLPGGQMKFQIVYDPASKHYFMVSSQTTDSLTRPELLPDERYGLPDNERHRLVLYGSRNLFDWIFLGLVAQGNTPKVSRHYASLLPVKKDLLILARSGDRQAASAHNGNLLTLHRISNFRELLY